MALKLSLGIVAAGLLLAPAAALAEATSYNMDPGHTEVQFGWSHAGVSFQHGEFDKTSGTLTLDPDNPEAAKIEVTITAESISTGFEPLDKHLKSADFLEVGTYPEIKFVSTSVKKTGDKTADIVGDLTMHGVTKPVTLQATMTHIGKHPLGDAIDYYKGDWVAFKATAEIANHQDFGVGPYSTGPLKINITTEMSHKP